MFLFLHILHGCLNWSFFDSSIFICSSKLCFYNFLPLQDTSWEPFKVDKFEETSNRQVNLFSQRNVIVKVSKKRRKNFEANKLEYLTRILLNCFHFKMNYSHFIIEALIIVKFINYFNQSLKVSTILKTWTMVWDWLVSKLWKSFRWGDLGLFCFLYYLALNKFQWLSFLSTWDRWKSKVWASQR